MEINFSRTRPSLHSLNANGLFPIDSRLPTAAMVSRCILTEITHRFPVYAVILDNSTGDSLRTTRFLPEEYSHQFRPDSTKITKTTEANTSVTMASNRSLKINLCVSAILSAAIVPAAICSARYRACARNPRAGSGAQIFCALAVIVADTSHTRGASVTRI